MAYTNKHAALTHWSRIIYGSDNNYAIPTERIHAAIPTHTRACTRACTHIHAHTYKERWERGQEGRRETIKFVKNGNELLFFLFLMHWFVDSCLYKHVVLDQWEKNLKYVEVNSNATMKVIYTMFPWINHMLSILFQSHKLWVYY